MFGNHNCGMRTCILHYSRTMKKVPRVKLRRVTCILLLLCLIFIGIWVYYRMHLIHEVRWISEPYKIVIVEEHHEVLRYWFDAAESGVIPKSGNTLLHVDAHSDFAPIDISGNFPPLFRWPHNGWQDIKYMMQRNDGFIQAAIMSGLFKRIIWVWPSWDAKSGEHEGLSGEFKGAMGWTIQTVRDEEMSMRKKKLLCTCMAVVNTTASKYEECSYLDLFADHKDDRDPSTILKNPSECNRQRGFKMEEYEENVALKFMNSGKLFEENESILLDVDEDYFGCESIADKIIMKSGIPWIIISGIDAVIDVLVCPKSTLQEKNADFQFIKIILFLTKNCDFSDNKKSVKQNHHKNCHGNKFLNALTKTTLRKLENNRLLCKMKYIMAYFRMREFIKKLLKLTLRQLEVLGDVGFCMKTTPKSTLFNESPFFQVCHGVNTPNESVVTFHSPTKPEIEKRMETLYKILSAPAYPKSKLTTVCRSSRDGYTPRGHFHFIEKNLLHILHNVDIEHTSSLIYDKDLLGGSRGWPGRHTSLFKKVP